MKLVPYRHGGSHLSMAQLLLKMRGMKPMLVGDVPEITFIVFEDEYELEPIGMGSLRLIEGHFGMLDGFITHPDKSSELRNEALNEIIKALMREAKDQGLKKVIALTTEESLILRVYHEGFGYVPKKVVVWNPGEK